jgi:hypothetical protein
MNEDFKGIENILPHSDEIDWCKSELNIV